MPATNVELSTKELELVVNSEFILTKNRIIQKVYDLFGLLSKDFGTVLHAFEEALPAEVPLASPKIYKGENYLGLPYVMMDHPRVFNKEDAFAIRCFFWWGHYFSITLHLSGTFCTRYKTAIAGFIQNEISAEYFVCINASPWEHHFEATNYIPLQAVPAEELLQRPFIKIAARLPLSRWNDAALFFRENYKKFVMLLVQ